jgi:hypothetical protein
MNTAGKLEGCLRVVGGKADDGRKDKGQKQIPFGMTTKKQRHPGHGKNNKKQGKGSRFCVGFELTSGLEFRRLRIAGRAA